MDLCDERRVGEEAAGRWQGGFVARVAPSLYSCALFLPCCSAHEQKKRARGRRIHLDNSVALMAGAKLTITKKKKTEKAAQTCKDACKRLLR